MHPDAKPQYLIDWELQHLDGLGVQVTVDPFWEYHPVPATPTMPLLRRGNQLDAQPEENRTSVTDLPYPEIHRLTAGLRCALCHQLQQRHGLNPGVRHAWPFERDELEQVAAIALWRALPKFRGESAFTTFAHRVMENAIASYERRHSRQPESLELRDTDRRPESLDDNDGSDADSPNDVGSTPVDPSVLPAIWEIAPRLAGGIELITAAYRTAHPGLRHLPLDTSEAGRKRRQRARAALRHALDVTAATNPRSPAEDATPAVIDLPLPRTTLLEAA